MIGICPNCLRQAELKKAFEHIYLCPDCLGRYKGNIEMPSESSPGVRPLAIFTDMLLINLHRNLHLSWNARKEAITAMIHYLVIKEFERRGIPHEEETDIDLAFVEQKRLGKEVINYGSFC